LHITPEVAEYINSLLLQGESKKDAELIALHDKGDRSYLHIPYSQGRFLETYARAIKAKNILEIGTFKGFSTAFLARGLAVGGAVITIDEDKRYVAEAEAFWKHIGVVKKINFKLGLAEKILKEMTSIKKSLEHFDLVFIDADKENYKKYTEYSFKLLRKGGTIIIDNTLWRGLVADKHTADNGAKHLKAFNVWVAQKFGKQASIIPAWDGLTIVVKK
jgi:predicted O-methyltransferase YrrM